MNLLVYDGPSRRTMSFDAVKAQTTLNATETETMFI